MPQCDTALFLQNTMQEFPFAWWHKCILLKGGSISSLDESIHCSQWLEDSIIADEMDSMPGLYDESNIKDVLLRLDGGVTSAVVLDSVLALARRLLTAFSSFEKSGTPASQTAGLVVGTMSVRDASVPPPSVAETIDEQQRQISQAMGRIGAPANFTMKCYSLAYTPATAQSLLSAGKTKYGKQFSCTHNMLMWIHNEEANVERYGIPVANGDPSRGTPGIQLECFRFRGNDIIPMGGSDGVKSPFAFIAEALVGDLVTSDPPSERGKTPRETILRMLSSRSNSVLKDGLRTGNFFKGEFNDKNSGLLMAEFIPPEITGLPKEQMPNVSMAASTILTSSTEFVEYREAQPLCVKVEDIQEELPQCHTNKDDPVPLDRNVCDNQYRHALESIEMYSNEVHMPLMGSSKPWPSGKGMHCVWDCGGNWDGYNEPLHEGLDDTTKTDFITQLDAWNKTCYDLADQKKSCLVMQTSLSVSGAVKVAMRSQFLQEVCGIYMTSYDKQSEEINQAIGAANKNYRVDINRYQDSMLSDQTASRYKNTNYATR